MNLFVVPSLRATQWRGNSEYKISFRISYKLIRHSEGEARRISYKPKLSFRAVGEESQAREKARPVRDISLSLKRTYKPSFRGHSPKNLIQDTKQDLLEIFRFRSRGRTNRHSVLDTESVNVDLFIHQTDRP